MIIHIHYNFIISLYSRGALILLLGLAPAHQGLAQTDVFSQNPEDTFESGQYPSQLQKLMDHRFEFRSNLTKKSPPMSPSSAQQTSPQGQTGDRIPVSIVDTGVDLSHPSLAGKLKIQPGSSGLAGYSFLSGRSGGTYRLIDPSPFAFGAKEIRRGKIVEPVPNPFDHLMALNLDFVTRLQQAILNDSVLSKSLYTKIDRRALHVLGVQKLLKSNPFDPEKFKDAKQGQRLITTRQRKMSQARLTSGGSIMDELVAQREFFFVKHLPWQANHEGLPDFGVEGSDTIWEIEHADRFAKILNQVFKDFAVSSGYMQDFTTYEKFVEQIYPKSASQSLREFAIERLSLDFRFRFDREFETPHRNLWRNLRAQMILAALLNGTRDPVEIEKLLKPQELLNFLRSASKVAADLRSYFIQTHKNQTEDKEIIADLLQGESTFSNLIEWFISRQESRYTASGIPQTSQNQRNLHKWVFEFLNPYYEASSKNESHGTKVAYLAARSGASEIDPIRIGLGVRSTSDLLQKRTVAAIEEHFVQWIQQPLVFRAIGSRFAEHFHGFNFGDTSMENRVRFSQLVQSEFKDHFNESLQSGFYESLVADIEMIKRLGESDSLIVNFSFGGEYQIPLHSLRNTHSPYRRKSTVFRFLEMEFLKYSYLQGIAEYAPNTLFVIALGNENQWVDGSARSIFPAGLRSPFLEAFEDPSKGELVPRLKNILQVGALSPSAELSQMNNWPLFTHSHTVFAPGEGVLTPALADTDEAVRDWLTTKISSPSLFYADSEGLSFAMSFGDAMDRSSMQGYFSSLISAEKKLTPAQKEKAIAFSRESYKGLLELLEMAYSAAALELHLEFPNLPAPVNGTSFATPIVVDRIAQLALEKAKAMGLSPRKLKGRDGFRPAELIDLLMKTTIPLAPHLPDTFRKINVEPNAELAADPTLASFQRFLTQLESKPSSLQKSFPTSTEVNDSKWNQWPKAQNIKPKGFKCSSLRINK